jgi:autotransporter-associated beta strand protein
MKSRPNRFLRLSAAAAFSFATSASADTALTVGNTTLDTTGNPALGVITRVTGATAWFNAAGTATATGTPLVNSILGPWATIGTGTGTRYATLDGSNNVVAYTGALASANFAWTSSNPATNNYDVAATGAEIGVSRTANTVRYTGGQGTQQVGNTSATLLTLNGLTNAGTGTLTFTRGSNTSSGVRIGATQELVLNAANAGLTLSAPIYNNTAGASSLTITGPNTVTLSGANTFTGALTVTNGSTLNYNNSTLNAASVIGSGDITTTGVNINSATDLTGFSGTFTHNGSTTVSTQLNAATATSKDAAYDNIAATAGNNQGMLAAGNGDYTLQMGSLSGVANSLIRGGNTATGTTTLQIGNLGTNTTFAGIIRNGDTKILALTKVGAGTLTLSGSTTHTGGTIVNAGVLKLGDGTNPTNLSDLAAVSIASGAKIDLDFSGTDAIGSLTLNGTGAGTGIFDAISHPAYFSGTGKLLVYSGPPATDNNGTWSASVDGFWEVSGNWASNTVAHGIDKTATFNGALGTTVTLLGDITIGNLDFSVEDYTIAGSGFLTLETTSGTPTISVATGRIATISAKLDGLDGIQKTGDGTLILSGANPYVGDTTVSAGSLSLTGSGTLSPGTIDLASGTTLNIDKSLAIPNTVTGAGAIISTRAATFSGDFSGFSGTYTHSATAINDSTTFTSTTATSKDAAYSITTAQGNGQGLLLAVNTGANTFEMGALSGIAGSLVRNSLSADPGTINTLRVGNLGTNTEFAGQLGGFGTGTFALEKVGAGTLTLSGTNFYTGNTTVTAGTLAVSSTGTLNFSPTTNGTTNSVSGTSVATLSFLGTVRLNLTAAVATIGNSWNLFNLGSFSGPAPTLTPTAVTSSTLGAFTEVSAGVWELPVTGAKWVFTESTGTLAYTTAATDYDTWKSANGVTGGENDDDDSDGLTNREEYAFGLNPTGGTSVNAIAVQLNKTTGTFSYTRRTQSLTGLTYTVWYSTNLAGWTEDTGAVEGTPVVNGQVETVEVTLTGSLLTNPKLFIQVRAE